MIPCMGGFCIKRDKCANYYADGVPIDRLCGPEDDHEPLTKNEAGRNLKPDPRTYRKPKRGGFKD